MTKIAGLQMAKIVKTRAELEQMMMDEAHKSGKCDELVSVTINGPKKGRSPNWDFGEYRERGPMMSSSCRIELQKIMGQLQQQFELSEE